MDVPFAPPGDRLTVNSGSIAAGRHSSSATSQKWSISSLCLQLLHSRFDPSNCNVVLRALSTSRLPAALQPSNLCVQASLVSRIQCSFSMTLLHRHLLPQGPLHQDCFRLLYPRYPATKGHHPTRSIPAEQECRCCLLFSCAIAAAVRLPVCGISRHGTRTSLLRTTMKKR